MINVLNTDEYTPDGEYNPHNVRPWLIYGAYMNLCIVYAECEGDAFDVACDEGALKCLELDPSDLLEREEEEWGVMYLGNAGIGHNPDTAGIVPLPNLPPDKVAEGIN